MLRASKIIWIQKNISLRHLGKGFYSSGSNFGKFNSVLGNGKVESPFNNSNRILRDLGSNDSQFSSKKEGLEEAEILKAEKHKETISFNDSIEPRIPLKTVETNDENPGIPPINDSGSNEEKEKRRKKMARNTYLGLLCVGGGTLAGLAFFCFHYGRAARDAEGNVIHDEFSDQQFGFIYRILNSFKLWRDYVVEPSREVLLPDPIPYPYHQPKYTLVIEMKNVLVSPEWTYKTGYRFKKRPALDYFLDVVGYPNFEVVIYTSESSMTAPSVIESMDPKGRIMYKLYRDTTKYMNGHHVKDLNKLNRDLKRVIYIDFDPKSFQLNPENVLRVPKWEGNMDDTALVDLAELLKTIHLSDAEDVRPTLQYYSQYDDPAKEFRKRAQYLAEQEEKKAYHQDDNQSGLKKYAGKLFGFRRHNSA
uniref:Mitochondrial import inner membrane translocase subunit TIM50 n=1 Tax=Panagrolaimus superbus TaxID=310955 RepID=A0A914XX51_9BILA